MNALRFAQKGAIESVLKLEQVPKPSLSAGEALVKVKAAGINGSDSVGIQGWIPVTTVPRIPGRDFSGEVVDVFDESAKEWVGKEVWGTGGARGFAFDGTYAEFTKVKVAELSKKPESLNHHQAASLGLSLVCAWIAVHRLSEVKPTDNVLVIGARGGIGSGVIQLVKEKGVTNIYGTYRTVPSNIPSGLKPIALPDATAISTALKASGDFGKIDVLVDCAGYEDPLNDALKAMRDQGRVVVMAVHRPDGRFSIDLRTFYMKSLVMKGLKSSVMSAAEVKEMLDYLSEKYDSGTIEPPKNVGTVSMTDLDEVHKALEAATTRSQDRIVILP